MTTLAQIREAISNAVDTIEGLRCSPRIVEQVNPPQAEVFRRETVYDEVQHGPDEAAPMTWQLGIRVFAARSSERTAQDLLDEYAEPIGDKSIKQTVESDPDLDELCEWVIVRSVGDVQPMATENVTYLVQEFAVEVSVS